ncbi:CC chemokine-like protein [Magpiepox virus 2]|nr:CC chemokine-like protein [Magpiepox virus 2]
MTHKPYCYLNIVSKTLDRYKNNAYNSLFLTINNKNISNILVCINLYLEFFRYKLFHYRNRLYHI